MYTKTDPIRESQKSQESEKEFLLDNHRILSKHSMVLRSQSSKNDFAYLQKHFPAAWYSSSMIGGALKTPCLGVIVQKNIVYQDGKENFTLRRGGVLVERSDKLVQAFQMGFFESNFVRCFSDGTKICGANEEKMAQAVLLSESNSQLRQKIEKEQTIISWKSLLFFWTINKRAKKMKRWNEEIQAHVRDLTLRHKMSLR